MTGKPLASLSLDLDNQPPCSNGLKKTTPFKAIPIGPMGTRVIWSFSFGSNGNQNRNFCTSMRFGLPEFGKTAVG